MRGYPRFALVQARSSGVFWPLVPASQTRVPNRSPPKLSLRRKSSQSVGFDLNVYVTAKTGRFRIELLGHALLISCQSPDVLPLVHPPRECVKKSESKAACPQYRFLSKPYPLPDTASSETQSCQGEIAGRGTGCGLLRFVLQGFHPSPGPRASLASLHGRGRAAARFQKSSDFFTCSKAGSSVSGSGRC